MAYLKSVGRGDKLTAIPKTGSGLDSQHKNDAGDGPNYPSCDDINSVVTHGVGKV